MLAKGCESLAKCLPLTEPGLGSGGAGRAKAEPSVATVLEGGGQESRESPARPVCACGAGARH